MESDNLLINEKQAAKRLSLSAKTLSKIRKRGEIAFVAVGRAIRYDVQSINAWIERARTTAAT